MEELHQFYQPDSYRVENSVGYLVHKLAHLLTKEVDRRMSEYGLTDAQWKPLLALHQGLCSTAADISRQTCQDTGAVTRLLDRLEAKALIRRVRSAEDRRLINLELTQEGLQVALETPKVLASLGNQVLAGFSEQEFTQLKSLLSRALCNAIALGIEEQIP
jgi:DNA-binding MarR family transcriptional regulator